MEMMAMAERHHHISFRGMTLRGEGAHYSTKAIRIPTY
jgi:hypothetical protein